MCFDETHRPQVTGNVKRPFGNAVVYLEPDQDVAKNRTESFEAVLVECSHAQRVADLFWVFNIMQVLILIVSREAMNQLRLDALKVRTPAASAAK